MVVFKKSILDFYYLFFKVFPICLMFTFYGNNRFKYILGIIHAFFSCIHNRFLLMYTQFSCLGYRDSWRFTYVKQSFGQKYYYLSIRGKQKLFHRKAVAWGVKLSSILLHWKKLPLQNNTSDISAFTSNSTNNTVAFMNNKWMVDRNSNGN